jgi:outer membrane protein OmpA-like peptidoglycan-associated protein
MNFKLPIFMIGAIFTSINLFAQNNYSGGNALDNYAGYTTSYFQPASIVNSLQKLSISGSLNALKTNNYSGTNMSVLSKTFGNESSRYRDHSGMGYQSRNSSIDLIGVSYEINHNHAIGLSFRIRSFGNLDGLSNEWTNAIHNDYDDSKPLNTPISFENYSYNQFIYLENRFNYARVIMNKKTNFLKAGIAFKIINGIDATYLYADNGSFQFNAANSSEATFASTEFKYGTAEKSNMFSSRNSGIGLDLGVVYEYRPKYNRFKYDMDGKTNIERYDRTKYLFKFGMSITDIGRVRFQKNSTSYDFTTNNTIYDAEELGALSFVDLDVQKLDETTVFKTFDDLAAASTVNKKRDTRFNMNLPTSLNLQADYQFAKNLFLGYTSSTALIRKSDAHKVHMKSIHSIVPRYSSPKMGIALPLSIQRNGQFNVGLSGRVSLLGLTNKLKARDGIVSIVGGMHNITGLLGKRARFNSNIFAGIVFNLGYKVPSDIDRDKVSDNKDGCLYDPGLLSLLGCPDTDGDGIPDVQDYCIYTPGPKKHNGCPDTDGDGVLDLNDQCPLIAGLPIHYGCPDRDKDGVIDVVDRCPDIAGIEFNNGCPFENPGCCTDNDGDGTTNLLDKCPEISGSIYNEGCPIDSTNLEKIELYKNKNDIDPNHTKEKIEQIKEEQPDDEMPDGNQITINPISVEITTVVNNDNEDKDQKKKKDRTTSAGSSKGFIEALNVYFDSDDATLSNSYNEQIIKLVNRYDFSDGSTYQIIIVGHTDNDGEETYNLILSKKRAETVRRKLETFGAKYDQIEVYYYGEWKPLKDNNNEEQKGFNRRVEIQVLEK